MHASQRDLSPVMSSDGDVYVYGSVVAALRDVTHKLNSNSECQLTSSVWVKLPWSLSPMAGLLRLSY